MEQKRTWPRGALSLNGFQIKLIALALMTVDHLGAYRAFPMSDALYTALRMVGRTAAPLFLFMTVEGLRHTRSRAKYALRLYLAGALTGAANLCLASATGGAADIGNVFPTLFYVALFVSCIEILRERRRPGRALAAACGIALPFALALFHALLFYCGRYELQRWLNVALPSPLSVEYSLLFVLLGVGWYCVRDRRRCALMLAGASLISLLVPMEFFTQPFFLRSPILTPYLFTAYHMFAPTQPCMVFAAPLMLCYNGERGRSMKYLFYAYYPLHQYLLFFLSRLWA